MEINECMLVQVLGEYFIMFSFVLFAPNCENFELLYMHGWRWHYILREREEKCHFPLTYHMIYVEYLNMWRQREKGQFC